MEGEIFLIIVIKNKAEGFRKQKKKLPPAQVADLDLPSHPSLLLLLHQHSANVKLHANGLGLFIPSQR